MALGATRWQVLRKVVVPGARTGILGAFTLATGRALGETVAVAMVIGNSPYIAHSLKSSAATLPSLIVNNFGESTGTELSALFGAGLVLLVIGILVNSVARWLVWSTGADVGRHGARHGDRPSSTHRPTRRVERRRAVQAAAASSLRPAQAGVEGGARDLLALPAHRRGPPGRGRRLRGRQGPPGVEPRLLHPCDDARGHPGRRRVERHRRARR